MTMIEIPDTLPVPRDQRELDAAVESTLGEHLRRESERYTRALSEHGLDVEVCTLVLDEFVSWCEASGLPSSASALAYFMLGLHRCGADVADLRNIARAFVVRSDWDIRIPIIAALSYCEAQPRVIEARMMH